MIESVYRVVGLALPLPRLDESGGNRVYLAMHWGFIALAIASIALGIFSILMLNPSLLVVSIFGSGPSLLAAYCVKQVNSDEGWFVEAAEKKVDEYEQVIKPYSAPDGETLKGLEALFEGSQKMRKEQKNLFDLLVKKGEEIQLQDAVLKQTKELGVRFEKSCNTLLKEGQDKGEEIEVLSEKVNALGQKMGAHEEGVEAVVLQFPTFTTLLQEDIVQKTALNEQFAKENALLRENIALAKQKIAELRKTEEELQSVRIKLAEAKAKIDRSLTGV